MSLRDLKSRLTGKGAVTDWRQRTCGECARFKDCSLLHRAGMVAPSLAACENFKVKTREVK